MQIKNRIKSNDELYGDFELIPLNSDAVQQRINFFAEKVGTLLKDEFYDGSELNKYYEAMNFWRGIKDNHCAKDRT